MKKYSKGKSCITSKSSYKKGFRSSITTVTAKQNFGVPSVPQDRSYTSTKGKRS